MRFLNRATTLDPSSARRADDFPAFDPLATPTSVRNISAYPVLDFSPSSGPSPSRANHTRSASLASKLSRAFSLDRRDHGPLPRSITAADISSPVVTPATPDSWYSEFGMTPRAVDSPSFTPSLLSKSRSSGEIMRDKRSNASALPRSLLRRQGRVFDASDGPPSPSPSPMPMCTIVAPSGQDTPPRHLRQLSMPSGRQLYEQPHYRGRGTPLPPMYGQSETTRRGPPSPFSAVSSYCGPPVPPSSPTATDSLHSTTSSRFRIKRKPAPSWQDDKPSPNNTPSSTNPPSPSSPNHTPTQPRWSVNMSESPSIKNLDKLFDELFDECRTAATSTSSPHRRTQSASALSTLQRTHAVRQPSRRALNPSRSQPQASAPPPLPPPTSEKKHHQVAAPNPFFPSGRSFEPIRAKSISMPKGTVKNRVKEFERIAGTPKGSPNTSTPVRHLGSILERSSKVDSNELTLESKRIMEEARRRRVIR